MMRFGPAGLGGIKEAVSNLQQYAKLGLKACEIAFTYGVYIKESQKKETYAIKESAEKYNIKLSIHAPYYINLNSTDKKKIEDSKKRILDCCKIADLLGAEIVVFHPGFYGKKSKEETYENIKKQILELLEEISKNKWKVKIAPETTGKLNVFGSVEEILKLVRETGCYFCLDFSHVYARNNGNITYKEIYENFKKFNNLHCHFSGIDFGEKGEKNHTFTNEKEIKSLLSILPKNKDITIINESPIPVEDAKKMLNFWERFP